MFPLIKSSCYVLPGIQLKDLIATNTALPDIVRDDLINVHKLITLSGIMSKFLVVQKVSPPVTPNLELLNMLRVSFFNSEKLFLSPHNKREIKFFICFYNIAIFSSISSTEFSRCLFSRLALVRLVC